ncbi:hypothetical protein Tco_1223032 [Tanacetum coccineum]
MIRSSRGKQRGHIPGVGRVLTGRGKNVLDVLVPRCNHTFDVNELKRSNKQLQKQIDMITKAMSSDDRMSQLFTQLQTQHESGNGSKSGAGGDDKSGDDETPTRMRRMRFFFFKVLIPETTFVGVESRVSNPETTFVGVESRVRVLHVPSRFQYADIFTKGLPSALFEEFRTSLSVRCPPAPTAGEC